MRTSFSDFINSSRINYEIYKLNGLKTIKSSLSRENFRVLYSFLIQLRNNNKELFIANTNENDEIIIKLRKKIPYISNQQFMSLNYKKNINPVKSKDSFQKEEYENVVYLSDFRKK